MSDSSGSGNPGDPYGKRPADDPDRPPPAQNPYGQPGQGQQQPPPYPSPYGQTPEQSPYGQQPAGRAQDQPASPYGQPVYGYGAASPATGKRPTTVTAAAVVTMVAAGLTGLLVLLSLAFLGTMREDVLREIERTSGFEDTGISADSLYGVVAAMFVVIAVWCLIAFILALFVLRGSNGARITLVVSASMAALFSLLAITSGASAITLVAAVAVIVLLFTGGASDWFRFRRAPQQPPQPGYPQQPPQPW